MMKKQIKGYIMAGSGFLLLLINALSYLLGWDIKNPGFTVLGIIFVFTGLKVARRP
jgi:hypothetical protein